MGSSSREGFRIAMIALASSLCLLAAPAGSAIKRTALFLHPFRGMVRLHEEGQDMDAGVGNFEMAAR